MTGSRLGADAGPVVAKQLTGASVELGRFGVTANMVYPPVTDTGWVNDEVW